MSPGVPFCAQPAATHAAARAPASAAAREPSAPGSQSTRTFACRRLLKAVVLAAEEDGQEVVDELMELYSACLVVGGRAGGPAGGRRRACWGRGLPGLARLLRVAVAAVGCAR